MHTGARLSANRRARPVVTSRRSTTQVLAQQPRVLALDVEYIHYKQAVPHTQPQDKEQRLVGGVRLQHLTGAPLLAQVAAQVQQLSQGALLIGHGVRQDLLSLGLEAHPDVFDLMACDMFKNKSGSVRSLRKLAAEHLKLDIHKPGTPHDPEQDARVVMRLYHEVVVPSRLSDYDALVAWHTQQLLAAHKQWQQEQSGAS